MFKPTSKLCIPFFLSSLAFSYQAFAACSSSGYCVSQTTGSGTGTLSDAITQVNSNPSTYSNTIDFGGLPPSSTITLSGNLPQMTASINIINSSSTDPTYIDGASQYSIFNVAESSTLTINAPLQIESGSASLISSSLSAHGRGGRLGAGGGLMINTGAEVIINESVTFSNCQAIGGSGNDNLVYGGYGGVGTDSGSTGNAGLNGEDTNGNNGNCNASNSSTTSYGGCGGSGGDGGDYPTAGDNGDNGHTGINQSGFGQPGGGGSGGGGAGAGGSGNAGGDGGKGGQGGSGGYGTGGGGGGAGLGGAIFIGGGSTLQVNAPLIFSGNSATGGTGNQNGTGSGYDIFFSRIDTNSTNEKWEASSLEFNAGTNTISITIPNVIEGDSVAEDLTLSSSISLSGSYLTLTLEKANGSNNLPADTIYLGYNTTTDTPYYDASTPTLILSANNVLSENFNDSGIASPIVYVSGTLTNSANNQIAGLANPIIGSDDVATTYQMLDLSSGTLYVDLSANGVESSSYTYGTNNCQVFPCYLGQLTGTGDLVIIGSGTQYLYVNNSGGFSGKVYVGNSVCQPNTGTCTSGNTTCVFNGDISGSGDPTVFGDGRLLAMGILSSTNNYGILGAGNLTVPGTLTINDLLLLQPDSQLRILFADDQNNSFVGVEGDAEITGAYALVEIPPGTDILNLEGGSFLSVSGSVTGSGFSGVTSNLFFMSGDLSFSDGFFYVEPKILPLDSFVINNKNAKAVGRALNTLIEEKDQHMVSVLRSFTYFDEESQLIGALNELQPAQLKAEALASENNGLKVQDALGFRMQSVLDEIHCVGIKTDSCSKKEKPLHVWMDGFGDVLRQRPIFFDGSPQYGYQVKTDGVTVGMDGHFAKYFYAGALGAYTGSSTHWTNGQGNGTISTGYGGLYFSAIGDLFYVNTSVTGGWGHLTEHRKIEYYGVNATASNKHGISQLLSHIDTGLNFGGKGWTIRPFDSLDYVSQTEGKFSEKGAGDMNLTVRKNNAILLRNELGLQFGGCICFKNYKWSISPKISWIREVRVKGQTYTAEFEGTDVPFTVTGYFPNRSLISPGVVVSSTMLQDLLHLDLYYNGEFGEKFTDHNYGGQIRFGF